MWHNEYEFKWYDEETQVTDASGAKRKRRELYDMDQMRQIKQQKTAESLQETQNEYEKYMPKDIPRMEGPNTPFEEYQMLPPEERWSGNKHLHIYNKKEDD